MPGLPSNQSSEDWSVIQSDPEVGAFAAAWGLLSGAIAGFYCYAIGFLGSGPIALSCGGCEEDFESLERGLQMVSARNRGSKPRGDGWTRPEFSGSASRHFLRAPHRVPTADSSFGRRVGFRPPVRSLRGDPGVLTKSAARLWGAWRQDRTTIEFGGQGLMPGGL